MIGKNIRDARLEAGLTQKELAERIGTTQPKIARWEKGEVTPGAQYLAKIAAALGKKVDEIISRG